MKTPDEYGVEAATKFNAHNPGHFPGRPLFEGVVAAAVRHAVAWERERIAEMLDKAEADNDWRSPGDWAEAVRLSGGE